MPADQGLKQTVFAALVSLLAFGANATASADECLDEIRALYDTALNDFARPPYRSQEVVYDAYGNVTRIMDSIVQTPLRTVSGPRNGQMALVIDQASWTRPNAQTGWTRAQSQLPEGREALLKRQNAEMAANVTETTCHGLVEDEGLKLSRYSFTTKTDLDENDFFFGSSNDVYIDPHTNQVVFWVTDDFTNPYFETPKKGRRVVSFEYDPTIRVDPPS